jgi:hypothetical protein
MAYKADAACADVGAEFSRRFFKVLDEFGIVVQKKKQPAFVGWDFVVPRAPNILPAFPNCLVNQFIPQFVLLCSGQFSIVILKKQVYKLLLSRFFGIICAIVVLNNP